MKWLSNYFSELVKKIFGHRTSKTLEDVVEKQTALEEELHTLQKTMTEFSESMIMLPPEQAKRVRQLRNYKFYPKKPS